MLRSFYDCAMSRKIVLYIYTTSSLACLMLSYGGLPPIFEAFRLLVAVTFAGYGIYFFNDLCDLKDDLKNFELGNPSQANRPLLRGTVSEGDLIKFTCIASLIGLVSALSINVSVFFAITLYLVLGFLYSQEPIRLKRRFVSKQLINASGHALTVLSGALVLGVITAPIIFLIAINFAISMGVNPLMDLRDLRGDKAMGLKTIPVVLGPRVAVNFALATVISILAASVVGYARLGFNLTLPILSTIILSAMIFTFYPLIKKWNEPAYVNIVMIKKFMPMYIALQLITVIGILKI